MVALFSGRTDIWNKAAWPDRTKNAWNAAALTGLPQEMTKESRRDPVCA